MQYEEYEKEFHDLVNRRIDALYGPDLPTPEAIRAAELSATLSALLLAMHTYPYDIVRENLYSMTAKKLLNAALTNDSLDINIEYFNNINNLIIRIYRADKELFDWVYDIYQFVYMHTPYECCIKDLMFIICN